VHDLAPLGVGEADAVQRDVGRCRLLTRPGERSTISPTPRIRPNETKLRCSSSVQSMRDSSGATSADAYSVTVTTVPTLTSPCTESQPPQASEQKTGIANARFDHGSIVWRRRMRPTAAVQCPASADTSERCLASCRLSASTVREPPAVSSIEANTGP
jgi:hypothetical protein